jgi:hypothetical protein
MTECTVHQAAEAFIGHLRESGKKERTLYTYRKDLDVVESFFGADRQLARSGFPRSASSTSPTCCSNSPTARSGPSAPSPRPSGCSA